MYLIPLNSAPNQTFTCSIPLNKGNVNFKFELRYNSIAKYWMATITNTETNEEIISNTPILSSHFKFIC